MSPCMHVLLFMHGEQNMFSKLFVSLFLHGRPNKFSKLKNKRERGQGGGRPTTPPRDLRFSTLPFAFVQNLEKSESLNFGRRGETGSADRPLVAPSHHLSPLPLSIKDYARDASIPHPSILSFAQVSQVSYSLKHQFLVSHKSRKPKNIFLFSYFVHQEGLFARIISLGD